VLSKNASASLASGVGTVVDHLSAGPPGKFELPNHDPYPSVGRFLPMAELLGGLGASWRLPEPGPEHPLVRRGLGWAPHSSYLCVEAVFKGLAGRGFASLVSVHVAESEEENEMWRTGKGKLLQTLRDLV